MTRARKVPAATVVTLSETHDRLSVHARYPSGGEFRFSLTRSGERLTWGGSADTTTARGEMGKFMAFASRLGKQMNNGARMAEIKRVAESVNSITELVASI